MSEEELVKRYLDGRLSRRSFIRKAMAAGVTATAALTYAEMLGSKAAYAAGDPGQPGTGTTGGTGGGYGTGYGGSGTTGGVGGVRRPKP
jgi:hypothetical protein